MSASTTLTDIGACIQINDGVNVRNITKAQIVMVSVIKSTIIKIDIGQGALNNIFINFSDVATPSTANAGALRDAINTMMAPSGGSGGTSGGATEAKQDTQITKLTDVDSVINHINTLLSSLDAKAWYDPLYSDETSPNVVYKGYAALGSSVDAPVWAISRTINTSGIYQTTWAAGSKNFGNVWSNREALSYS